MAGRSPVEASETVALASSASWSGTSDARSPLWTERSLWRELVVLRVDFDTVKEAATQARRHHQRPVRHRRGPGRGRASTERAGQPVDELRMAMPMSTRDDKSAAGNAFSLTRSLVPVDIDDPVEHLHAVHELLAATRGEKAFQVLDQLARG